MLFSSTKNIQHGFESVQIMWKKTFEFRERRCKYICDPRWHRDQRGLCGKCQRQDRESLRQPGRWDREWTRERFRWESRFALLIMKKNVLLFV